MLYNSAINYVKVAIDALDDKCSNALEKIVQPIIEQCLFMSRFGIFS